jgi:hypothetical protein
MPATLQKFSSERIIDPNHEYLIKCSYCDQKYLLAWDDKEWNSVRYFLLFKKLRSGIVAPE